MVFSSKILQILQVIMQNKFLKYALDNLIIVDVTSINIRYDALRRFECVKLLTFLLSNSYKTINTKKKR